MLGVNYSPAICATNGSSVNMSCSYTSAHGEIIQKVFWVKGKASTDVALDPHYTDRIHVDCEDKGHKCNLRIKNLTKSDGGMYYCRVISNSNVEWNSRPNQGVKLSVTGK